MKVKWNSVAWGLALVLSGGLMAEQLSQKWMTIKDEETGLNADFPRQPLELTFEIPFENTPPMGKVHLYSVPTQTGILVASAFSSPLVNSEWLQKDRLYQFFETILVPHFFFNPAVFQDKQIYTYHPTQIEGKEAASFELTYFDRDLKKLEGIARVKESTLYIYFYLASETSFDQKMFEQFLQSVK